MLQRSAAGRAGDDPIIDPEQVVDGVQDFRLVVDHQHGCGRQPSVSSASGVDLAGSGERSRPRVDRENAAISVATTLEGDRVDSGVPSPTSQCVSFSGSGSAGS